MDMVWVWVRMWEAVRDVEASNAAFLAVRIYMWVCFVHAVYMRACVSSGVWVVVVMGGGGGGDG